MSIRLVIPPAAVSSVVADPLVADDGEQNFSGSIGVAGGGTFGGILSIDDTTNATSTTTGSIHTDGGLGVVGDTFISGNLTLGDTASPFGASILTSIWVGYTVTDPTALSGALVPVLFGAATSGANDKQISGTGGYALVAATNTQNWTHKVGFVGVGAEVMSWVGSTGTITGGTAFFALGAQDFGANFVNTYGLFVENNYAGTYTSTHGIYIEALTRGSDNNYGIKIEAPSGGSGLNDAIHVVGGRTYLGGDVEVAADIHPSTDMTLSVGTVAKRFAAVRTKQLLADNDTAGNVTLPGGGFTGEPVLTSLYFTSTNQADQYAQTLTPGSIVVGVINKVTAGTGKARLEAGSGGSTPGFVFGAVAAQGNFDAKIEARQGGAVAFGGVDVYTADGLISSSNSGLSFGYASTYDRTAEITTAWAGGLAFGSAYGDITYAGGSAKIWSYGYGAIAGGRAYGGNIESKGAGSVALGYATGGYLIQATDYGSWAVGSATGADIKATAANAFQFGQGTNALADSFQVGNAGLRLKGTVNAPASPQNGDFWVASSDVYCRSGGVSKNLSSGLTAAASIGDNKVVRGDGGTLGVQESLPEIDDSGNIHPPTDGTLSVGTAAKRFAGVQTKQLLAINDASTLTLPSGGDLGKPVLVAVDFGTDFPAQQDVAVGSPGSVVMGRVNKWATGSGKATLGAGATGTSFVFGYAVSGYDTYAKVEASDRGGFAAGYASSWGGPADDATVQSFATGATVFGCALANDDYATIAATGDGSFAFGRAYGDIVSGGRSIIEARYGGSFAGGNANGATIKTVATGAFAFGYADNFNDIIASGAGSHAQGSATNNSIIASGAGSHAQGSASGTAGSGIRATAEGCFAGGAARGSNDIRASNIGSFAFGDSTNGDIQATAANAFQFGVGTNALADSFQVGNAGLRLKGTVNAPASPQDGDFWVASSDVYCRSGGVSKNLSSGLTAAASIVDNRVVRGDGGALGVQGSGWSLDDSDNMTAPGALTCSGIVSTNDTTNSTSSTTGSIHTDGGLGVAGNTYLGGDITGGGDLTISSDTDATTILGRWKLFSSISDHAMFAHVDYANSARFALKQGSGGEVILNARTGSNISFSSENVIQFQVGVGELRAQDAAGPALLNEAATSTNPTLIPNRAELSTGIGGTIGSISAVVSGTEIATVDGDGLAMANANGPILLNEAASYTNPTICPDRNQLDLGLGTGSTDMLSIIANSLEHMRIGGGAIYCLYNMMPFIDTARSCGTTARRWSSVFSLNYDARRDAIGEVSADAAVSSLLHNDTAAADGAQQHSPMLVQEGQGWDGSATQEVQWGQQVIPVQAAGGDLVWFSNIADGGFTERLRVTSAGQVLAQDGDGSTPGLSFASSPGVGFYPGAADLRLTVANNFRMIWGNGTTTSYQHFNVGSNNLYDLGSENGGWRRIYQNRTIGALSTDAALGIEMENATAAVSGTQQYSPMLVLEGQGMGEGVGTQEVQFGMQVVPVQAATNPTGELHFFSNIDNAGFTSRMSLSSAGILQMTAPIQMGISDLRFEADNQTYLHPIGNGLDFIAGSTLYFRIWANAINIYKPIHAVDVAGPAILNEASAADNPTLVPDQTDETAGIGGTGGDVSIITGGAERINIDSGGNITIASGITAAADTDESFVFGRLRLDALAADHSFLSHVDQAAATTYSMRIGPSGDTVINSAAGENISFRIANANVFSISATELRAQPGTGPSLMSEAATATNPTLIPNHSELGTGIGGAGNGLSLITLGVERINVAAGGDITIASGITAAADTNTTFIFGRAKLWSPDNDNMQLSHFDVSTNGYAIKQNPGGETFLNATGGSKINFSILQSAQFKLDTTNGFYANDADGPAILNEASSVANPVLLTNRGDPTTGIGGVSGNVTIITNGARVMDFEPTRIRTYGDLWGGIAGGPAFVNQEGTATNPTLCPNRVNTDTGIGGSALVGVTVVVSGTEVINFKEDFVTLGLDTGLGFDEVGTVPRGDPGAAKGTVWQQDLSPTTLVYTDDTNVDHDLVTDHYGEIYVYDGSTTQVTNGSADTFDIVEGFNTAQGFNGESSGITAAKASNKLTFAKTGKYCIEFRASFTGTTNEVYTLQAFVNGSADNSCVVRRKIGTGTDVGSLMFCGFISATAGQDLDVRIAAAGVSSDFIPVFMGLNARWVGK